MRGIVARALVSVLLLLGPLTGGTASTQQIPVTHPARRVVASVLPSAVAVAVDYRTARVFALNMGDSTLTVLDARSGALLHTQDVGMSSPEIAVEETSGHVFVPSAISDTVDMRDGATGRLLRSIVLPQRPLGVIPTGRQGRVLVVVGMPTANGARIRPRAQIVVLDGQTGRVVRAAPLLVPQGLLSAVAIDVPQNHLVLAMGATLAIVDALSGVTLHVATAPRPISALPIDRHTDRLFAIGRGAAAQGRVVQPAVLYTLNNRTGAITRTRPLGQVILAAATADVDELTRRLFIASSLEPVGRGFGGRVIVVDSDTGAVVRTSALGPSASALALARRAGRVFVTADFSRATQMLDARTGAVVRTIILSDPAQALAVDERTNRAFIATALAVYTVDAPTGTILRTTGFP